MKTYFPKPQDSVVVNKNWYLIDAKDIILGKVAVKAADLLRGKHKPMFSPHFDTGDNVIIINAKDIKVTGSKMKDKMYRSHSGYMGSLKELSLQEMLAKSPTSVLEKAVAGMLPKNKLRRELLKKLKLYVGPEHPHSAQKPIEIKL